MASQWYITRAGEQSGPFTGREVKELVASGRLHARDMVWKEGMSEWVAAGRIKGLFLNSATGAEVPAAATTPMVACPHCTGHIACDSTQAGRVFACPHCESQFQMPGAPVEERAATAGNPFKFSEAGGASKAHPDMLGAMSTSPPGTPTGKVPVGARKVSLLQEVANAHKHPSSDSAVMVSFKTGDIFYVYDVVEADGNQWARVCDINGIEAFVPGDTRIEDVGTHRFLVERATFIAVASFVAGVIIGPQAGFPMIGLIAIIAFMATSVYATAKMFVGVGGFFEFLPADTTAPLFDWRKFVFEPVYLIGVTLAMFLFFGLVGMIMWAMKGIDK